MRIRRFDIIASLSEHAADNARNDAARVIEAWNRRLAAGGPVWFSPTIGAALVAGYRWLEVLCPGCQTIATVDLAAVDRYPDASLGSFV
jgi:hypothetical protein